MTHKKEYNKIHSFVYIRAHTFLALNVKFNDFFETFFSLVFFFRMLMYSDSAQDTVFIPMMMSQVQNITLHKFGNFVHHFSFSSLIIKSGLICFILKLRHY